MGTNHDKHVDEEIRLNNSPIRHMATTDVWEVEEKGIVYTVRRHETWQDGRQEWDTFIYDERNIRIRVENPKYHEIVRMVQEHLLQR